MGLLKRRGGSGDGPPLTLFHAADLHGADPCWRKFVGAGRFYDADAVILGGDLAGNLRHGEAAVIGLTAGHGDGIVE